MKNNIKTIISAVLPEVKKTFDENYSADSIETLATNYNVNRNALQDAFKQECGMGIRKYKLNQRMEVAIQMLKEGKGIKEIAFTLRYGAIGTFSRAFKKYHGVNPTEWNKIRQNA